MSLNPIPGPEFSPTDDGDRSERKRHSLAVSTVPNDEEKDCIFAKIAVEYYNKENGTSYELAGGLLLCNEFMSEGTWVHCNFAARKPDQDMNGTSSRKLFFAEMHGEDDVTVCNWTVTACVVLKGTATVGCSLCSEVIHPTHGFCRGHHKPKHSSQPTTSSPASYLPTQEQLKPSPGYYHLFSPHLPNFPTMSELPYVRVPPLAFPTAEQVSDLYRERAGIALEYYNKEKGANYELVDVLVCKSMSSGTWFHCNFTAKPPKGGESSSKLFFGEICLRPLTATGCVVLEEGGKTTNGCYLCPDTDVVHPTHGFVKERGLYTLQPLRLDL